jgi:hypothetical protein
VRLLRSLPERFKVDIKVKEGTHQSENAGESSPFEHSIKRLPGNLSDFLYAFSLTVNKQLNDKERVAGTLQLRFS